MRNLRSLYARALGVVCMLAIACGVAFGLAGNASAHPRPSPYPPPPGCAVSTSDSPVHAGEAININGSGFVPGSAVVLTVHSTRAVVLGTVHPDLNGSFATFLTIPSSIGRGAHTIVASSPSATCSFTISADGSDSAGLHTERGDATTGPAETGVPTASVVAIALALLGAGLVFGLVGRRRRQD